MRWQTWFLFGATCFLRTFSLFPPFLVVTPFTVPPLCLEPPTGLAGRHTSNERPRFYIELLRCTHGSQIPIPTENPSPAPVPQSQSSLVKRSMLYALRTLTPTFSPSSSRPHLFFDEILSTMQHHSITLTSMQQIRSLESRRIPQRTSIITRKETQNVAGIRGCLTSRPFFDVEPCEVIRWNVLPPTAAIRDSNTTSLRPLNLQVAKHTEHVATLPTYRVSSVIRPYQVELSTVSGKIT